MENSGHAVFFSVRAWQTWLLIHPQGQKITLAQQKCLSSQPGLGAAGAPDEHILWLGQP